MDENYGFLGSIGKEFEILITPLLNSIKQAGVAPLLALVILIIGLGMLAYLIYKWQFEQKPILNKTLAIFDKYNSAADFDLDYEIVTEDLSNLKGIRTCWGEFTETMIIPDENNPHEQDEVIQNTVRPQEYFSTEQAGFDTPLIKIMPNVFVGIGLAVTFLGLIAVLTDTTTTIQGGGDMQGAVQTLLVATSAKFYTSFFALAMSIVLTITLRIISTKRDQLFQVICEKIEALVKFVSQEGLAIKQLQLMKEQKTQLETFNTDLAMRLGETIQSAMKPVTEKLDEMTSNMGHANEAAMRQIGADVARQIQGAAGDSLNSLGDRLDTLGQVLSNLSGSLQESSNQFGTDISATFESIKTEMAKVATSLTNTANKTSDTMGSKLEELANSLTSAASDMKKSMQDGAKDLTSELTTAITALTTATNKSAQKMEEAVTGIKDAMQGVIKNLEEGTNEAIESASGSVTDAGDKAAEAFKKAGETLSDALKDSSKDLISSVELLSKKLNDAETSVNSLNSGLSATATSLENATTGVNQSVNNLTTASNKIQPILAPLANTAEELKKTSETISGAVSRMQTELEETGKLWERHVSRYDTLDGKLGVVFDRIQKNLEDSLTTMGTFVNNIDNSFSSSIVALDEAVQELADATKSNNQ